MKKNLFPSLLLLLPVFLFAGPLANQYISLKEKPVWTFTFNGNTTFILVKDTETINKNRYYRVECHFGQIRPAAPFYTEFWFEKGDSILCAGTRVFGSTLFYSKPYLVIANTTKVGDTWSVVIGKGPFSDTARYTADLNDTLENFTGGTYTALRITKTTRSGIVRRWFAKGKGIVKETKDDNVPSQQPVMLK